MQYYALVAGHNISKTIENIHSRERQGACKTLAHLMMCSDRLHLNIRKQTTHIPPVDMRNKVAYVNKLGHMQHNGHIDKEE